YTTSKLPCYHSYRTIILLSKQKMPHHKSLPVGKSTAFLPFSCPRQNRDIRQRHCTATTIKTCSEREVIDFRQ
ncbi:hypothetical protein, partial [Xylanibacter rodentium]|uniref:hypothetical protein n=1 Tax=Xylanibacter rodentium TaxID=2736289 RepID=UPI0025889014